MLPAFMVKQIAKSQDAQLLRFLSDKNYACTMSLTAAHARIHEWAEGQKGDLLELGCGPGKYVAMFSSLGFQVTGVDPISFPTWKALEQQTPSKLISNVYAEDLPFPNSSFDHVACLGALLYFEDPRGALRELHRVLKPGGKLILRTVNKSNLYTSLTGEKLDPASKNLYSMSELESLVSGAGFCIDRKFSYGFWPPVLTNFWWYLVCVWLPIWLQNGLSNLISPSRHVNNIIFATKH
ncbi:MAG: methyltransferase domain-containing protein [Rhodospirillales bacterium]|nr:methyltransferase domain-containing protein [Rhodospirillales bacterium]